MALIPVMPTSKLKHGIEICKIANGMWQVSGAHGKIDPNNAVLAMSKYAEVGLTTFDMADIYGPAEDIFGKFMNTRDDTLNSIQGLTKMVPRAEEMTREKVESRVNKSMSRMGVQKLDCLQFHWWNYDDKRYLQALQHLSDLQKEGKIVELSLTNFDTQHMKEVVDQGISISTNQVQYSLVDMRPSRYMKQFCEENDIKLLCYGTLCGGLLTEKYLDKPEPKHHELNTASLGKYKHMIDLWGGWNLFQKLLKVLNKIANQHTVSIANVAVRYILEDETVGAVIIGCRFGKPGCNHIKDNYRSISKTWSLTSENLRDIEAVLNESNDLMSVIGDCGSEYR